MSSSIPANFQSKIKILETGGFDPNRVRWLCYGDSGVGKTVFASTWPSPLFLNIDDGLASVSIPGVASWDIQSYEEFYEALGALVHTDVLPFATIVLDSMNELQKLIMDYVIRAFPSVRRAYDSQPGLPDYGKAFSDFEKVIRALKSLPVNVVFLAQVKERVMETDTVSPLLSGKGTPAIVCRMMDEISYLYKGIGSEGNQPRILAMDVPQYVTKDRSGKLPPMHEIQRRDHAYEEIRAYWVSQDR